MTHLEFNKIFLRDKALKENKVWKLAEPIVFGIRLVCKEDIEDGVEFTVLYNMDVHTDNKDQVLSCIEVSPVPKGLVEFDIEANAPDISLIPADQIFGTTSIIVRGAYKGRQFVRIGYIVSVGYPEIPTEILVNEEVDGESSEEILEVETGSSHECDEDAEDEEENEDDDHEEVSKKMAEAVEENGSENQKQILDNEESEEEDSSTYENSDSCVGGDQEETAKNATKADGEEKRGDVFEYRGYTIDTKKIEIEFLEPPIVTPFEIDWEIVGSIAESDKYCKHESKRHKTEE